MSEIIITIPGEPVAQARSRNRKGGGHYDPLSKFKSGIAMLIKSQAKGMEPMTGPIAISFEFRMKRPKSHYGTGKNSDTLKPSAPYYHTSVPDWDNLAKLPMDCMKGIIWKDDSQVCVVNKVIKKYAEINPATIIRIGRI